MDIVPKMLFFSAGYKAKWFESRLGYFQLLNFLCVLRIDGLSRSHLWNHWSKNELTRTIGLFSKKKVEEWKFIDVEVKIDITIGSHRSVWFFSDTRYFLLSQSSNIKKGGEKQSRE